MGNTINVAGSYIDIHDNEVVNLTVDKGVVSLSQESQQVNAVEAEGNQESEGAEELLSDKAMSYWKALQEAGFTDERRMLRKGVSRSQAMYIAERFAERLRLQAKWKPFEALWGKSNLAQEAWKMKETGLLPKRYEEIDRIFRR